MDGGIAECVFDAPSFYHERIFLGSNKISRRDWAVAKKVIGRNKSKRTISTSGSLLIQELSRKELP